MTFQEPNLENCRKKLDQSINSFCQALKHRGLEPNPKIPFVKFIELLKNVKFVEKQKDAIIILEKAFSNFQRFLVLHSTRPKNLQQFFADLHSFGVLGIDILSHKNDYYNLLIFNKCLSTFAIDESPYYSIKIDNFYFERQKIDIFTQPSCFEPDTFDHDLLINHLLSRITQVKSILFIITDTQSYSNYCETYNHYNDDFLVFNDDKKIIFPLLKSVIYIVPQEYAFQEIIFSNYYKKGNCYFLFDIQKSLSFEGKILSLYLHSQKCMLFYYCKELPKIFSNFTYFQSTTKRINIKVVESKDKSQKAIINVCHSFKEESLCITKSPKAIIESFLFESLLKPGLSENPIKYVHRIQKLYTFHDIIPYEIRDEKDWEFVSKITELQPKISKLITVNHKNTDLIKSNNFSNVVIDIRHFDSLWKEKKKNSFNLIKTIQYLLGHDTNDVKNLIIISNKPYIVELQTFLSSNRLDGMALLYHIYQKCGIDLITIPNIGTIIGENTFSLIFLRLKELVFQKKNGILFNIPLLKNCKLSKDFLLIVLKFTSNFDDNYATLFAIILSFLICHGEKVIDFENWHKYIGKVKTDDFSSVAHYEIFHIEDNVKLLEYILPIYKLIVGNYSLKTTVQNLYKWIQVNNFWKLIKTYTYIICPIEYKFHRIQRPPTIFGDHQILYSNGCTFPLTRIIKNGIFLREKIYVINIGGKLINCFSDNESRLVVSSLEIPEQCYHPLFRTFCYEIYDSYERTNRFYLIEDHNKFFITYSGITDDVSLKHAIKVWPFAFRSLVYFDRKLQIGIEIYNNGIQDYQTNVLFCNPDEDNEDEQDDNDEDEEIKVLHDKSYFISINHKTLSYMVENINLLIIKKPPIRISWLYQNINYKKQIILALIDKEYYHQNDLNFYINSWAEICHYQNYIQKICSGHFIGPNFHFPPALLEFEDSSRSIKEWFNKYHPNVTSNKNSFKGEWNCLHNLYRYLETNSFNITYNAYKVGASDLSNVVLPDDMYFSTTYNAIVTRKENEEKVFSILRKNPQKMEYDENIFGCSFLCNENQIGEYTLMKLSCYCKDESVVVKSICKNCIKNSLRDTIQRFIPENDFDSIKEKLPSIPIMDSDYDKETKKYFPSIPYGLIIFNLCFEDCEFEMLIDKYLKGVFYSTIFMHNYMFARCPDHPTAFFRKPKSKNQSVFCKIPSCYNILCAKCHEWHHFEANCPKGYKLLIRKCPFCERASFKESGCNRITCPCGCSWCYICGEGFKNIDDCYAHLYEKHGGYFQAAEETI
ncbi:hypothetical protein TRFO_19189 [Tritrichomonas foetus]|uniref:C2H2-type domain-containing protein n=1 Tax=Tritrichomonas foetus TaxID=1144522 RepID=A0A1J4KNV3_9EUKA|nr:hypothetical protein TRFO_19189 [Tritrichomonas foetus]|eukprot:OHT11382.1 hypothetical protein TRFO_19189 [Tritrichomonas foetus]